MRTKLALAIILMMCSGSVLADKAEHEPRARALMARVQSMTHGYYPAADWEKVFAEIDAFIEEASACCPGLVLQLERVRAMVVGQALDRKTEAIQRLRAALDTYGDAPPEERCRVYTLLADFYARMGDEEAIGELIQRFKDSSLYHPEAFDYEGGQGRDVPLKVMRPHAKGADSITVTAMERSRREARFSPGNLAPVFEAVDSRGIPVKLTDFRGRVVLLDFWQAAWTPWRRDLAVRRDVYQRFRSAGFEILGLNLDYNKAGAAELIAGEGLAWIQVSAGEDVARKYGLFGETSNFLINQDGIIVGRNLYGAQLEQAVQATLPGPDEL